VTEQVTLKNMLDLPDARLPCM